MTQPTLTDLHLVINDLKTRRMALLRPTGCWGFYGPLIEAAQIDLDSLPEVATTPARKAELAAADAAHDGFGASLWMTTEAMLRLVGIPDELREAAARIRTSLIPELRELKDSYADEAQRAMARRGKLAEIKADLTRFPVAWSQWASQGSHALRPGCGLRRSGR